ncbi:hypothetical protein VTN96DRAFT_10441 [Rasamsonia emersonii]
MSSWPDVDRVFRQNSGRYALRRSYWRKVGASRSGEPQAETVRIRPNRASNLARAPTLKSPRNSPPTFHPDNNNNSRPRCHPSETIHKDPEIYLDRKVSA